MGREERGIEGEGGVGEREGGRENREGEEEWEREGGAWSLSFAVHLL